MSDNGPKRTQPPVNPLSDTGTSRSGTRPSAPEPNETVARDPNTSASVNLSASGSAPRVLSPSGAAPAVSAVVAGYEILNELGRGAMGVVYKARHAKLNRVVALKMTLGARIDPKDLIRFLAEAEAVASVKHDNVVQVYDYGDHQGKPYMALEFCPAGALSDVLKESGPLHPTDAAEVVAKIAQGVAAAHDQGIVHRDLKPANILLQIEARRAGEEVTDDEIATMPLEDLIPKVSDFGLAKRATNDLTATQAVMGTPSYMSPEQAVGKTKFVGPQADVWALGVILYEALTGTKPFTGQTSYEVMAQILSEEPESVRTIRAKVPYDLELIVRKCLEKAAADRYPTARELSEDLDRFVRGEPISVRPLSTATKVKRWVRRNKAVTALLAMVVLSTFGLIGALYAQYRTAVGQADAERSAKEGAEAARTSAELARVNAEKAANETKLREAAQVAATKSAAEAAQANVIVEMLNDLFRSSDPLALFFGDAAPALGVGGPAESQAAVLGPFLRAAAERFRNSLTDPSAAPTRARLLAGIGNGMKALGMYGEAKPLLEEALAIRKRTFPENSPEVWQSELDLGRLEAEGGDLLAGIERFRRVHALQKKAKVDPAVIYTTRFYEAVALSTLGMPEAGDVLKEVLDGRTALLGRTHRDTVLTKIGLIAWYLEKGETAKILTLFNEFRDDVKNLPDKRIREIFGPILDAQVKMATGHGVRDVPVLLKSAVEGMKTEAAKLEKLIPPDHLVLCIFRFEIAEFELILGNGDAADALFARVLSDARKTVGMGHPRVLLLLEAYSRRLAATDRAAEARKMFEEVEAANLARFGPENPWRTLLLLKRARFEFNQGDAKKARESVKAAVDLVQRKKFLPTISALNELFATARRLGDAANDVELRTATRALFTAIEPLVGDIYGKQSDEMMILLSAEGQQLYEAGSRRAAGERLEKGLQVAAKLDRLSLDDWANLYYWSGRLAMDRGEFAVAEGHFRNALTQGKRWSGFPAADHRAYADYWGRALAAQGNYTDAVKQFEVGRKQIGAKEKDSVHLWGDFQVATAQLAGADRAGYDKTLAKMSTRCEKLTDADSLSRLAWAGGLAAKSVPWDAKAFEVQYTSAMKTVTNYPWGWRGLALVRVRAGKLDAVEEALAKAGPTAMPVDHLIRGLLAVARGDKAAAKESLAKAEALIEKRRPTESNPYAYAGRLWHMQVEDDLLLAELRAAVGAPKE